MYISCYKPNVRSLYDFCSISHINQWLQTLCSFPMRFLGYFIRKSVVTIPIFVPNAISAIFRMESCGYKPYVRSQCDFCSISHINLWRQSLCSFPMQLLHTLSSFPMRFLDDSHVKQCLLTRCLFSVRFLQYFIYKSKVTDLRFVLIRFLLTFACK